ncbi:MAG: rubrerythrin [Patescibacteria group bacterium]|jgi:rubrerythrin
MDGIDLRKFQEAGEEQDKIRSIMGKVLSGREGYEAIVEERKDVLRCAECNWSLEGGEKFCPECGHKNQSSE